MSRAFSRIYPRPTLAKKHAMRAPWPISANRNCRKRSPETNSLVKEEPKNPYFWEILGQIYVGHGAARKRPGPYQKSVDLTPDAPLLRGQSRGRSARHGQARVGAAALQNLKIALQQENDNTFAWYEMAQAY